MVQAARTFEAKADRAAFDEGTKSFRTWVESSMLAGGGALHRTTKANLAVQIGDNRKACYSPDEAMA